MIMITNPGSSLLLAFVSLLLLDFCQTSRLLQVDESHLFLIVLILQQSSQVFISN